MFYLLSFIKEFDKYYAQIILFGSVTITCTLIVLLSCFTLVFMDYSNIIFLVTRAIVAFVLFRVIKNKNAGFEDTDLKPMHDCIQFIVFPGLLLCTVNMKIDLLATFPLSIICINYSYKSAFTTEGDNMDCYNQAELAARNLFSRTMILMLIFMFACHDLRKTQIMHFIAQERSKK